MLRTRLNDPHVAMRLLLSLVVICTLSQTSHAQTCARTDFEAVVDDAAEALRKLNAENKPGFQERLRTLRAKRGWSHDEFLLNAAPFVQDDTIDAFDQRSQNLLSDIANLGEEGTATATPDCSLLTELRRKMQELVNAQTEKWEYMFKKLHDEIGK